MYDISLMWDNVLTFNTLLTQMCILNEENQNHKNHWFKYCTKQTDGQMKKKMEIRDNLKEFYPKEMKCELPMSESDNIHIHRCEWVSKMNND